MTLTTIKDFSVRVAMMLLMMLLTTATGVCTKAGAKTVSNVPYVDADGIEQTATYAAVVTSDMGGTSNPNFNSGSTNWFYVNSDVTLSGAYNTATTTQNIILGDGATLTISGQFKFGYASVNIYCQSGGTGKLVVSATYSDDLFYIGSNHTLTINGGTVEVTNQNYGNAFSGNLVMNGGTASFNGKKGFAMYAIFGTVTLNGGTFTATSNDYASEGICSSYVTIGDGKYFKDGSGNIYYGSLSNAQKNALNGVTLTPATQTEYIQACLGAGNDGSASKPYTISDAAGWDAFCLALQDNDTWNRFSGKTVSLDADITVTRMAGSDGHEFQGNFDGGSKTLTFTATAADNYCAPFVGVKGGTTAETATTISNLNVVTTITANDYRHMAGLIALQWGHVNVSGCNATVNISSTVGDSNPHDLYPAALVSQASSSDGGTLTVTGCTASGTISTDGKYAAGLVGIVQGTASISDCISSVTIDSSTSGDGTHGGIVAVVTGSGTITGCVFNGKLLTVNTGETATGNCAGFVAWGNGTISNCLYAPAAIEGDEAEVVAGTGNYPSGTFYRGTAPTVTNCYYTRALGTAQGKQARSITAGENVTIEAVALTGTATQYTVSGITAYSGGGLQYGGKLYYGENDNVSLTLSANREGYAIKDYQVSAGTLSGSANPYTLTMPDENVTISAALAPIDWATESEGTEAAPYMIYNKDQLNLLAQRVNNGTSGYTDKYFKLGNDIIYNPDELTIDNDNDGTNDSNYEAIGSGSDGTFNGHFNGDNKTISGIRIYKGGTNKGDKLQGLFGITGSSASIYNLNLVDADITGYFYTGGIVGYNSGSVSNCHVAASVIVRAVQNEAHNHGGIVGRNRPSGTVSSCTSSATLAVGDDVTNRAGYGGIAGYNDETGKLIDNLVIGAVVPTAADNSYGAICGYNRGTIARNYYRACTVANSENATGVGCNKSDVTDDNGAVSIHTLTLGTGITTTSQPAINIDNTDYYAGTITLSGGLPDDAPEHYTYAYTVNGNAISGNTFTINADAVVSVDTNNLYPADWATEGNSGTETDPYMIYNKEQLDLLAHRVNGTHGETANDFNGVYFKLGANITYDPQELTIDNDNDGTNDSNYEAIGSGYRSFNGHFNGDNKTISGIRIYKGGTGDGDGYQGLFGRTGSSASIRNVTLADADITGYRSTGGIVGENYGTVSDCHVAASVFIRAVQNGAYFHGGIVGYNRSTVTNCTSRSTLTIAKGVTGCQQYGGIAGINFGTLTDNLAIGAVVPATAYNTYGAICGNRDGTMARNYYRACKVASENVTQGGVGCHNRDFTDNNGAVPACTLTLDTGITTTSETVINIDDEDYYAGTITLSGDLPDGAPEHYTYAYTVNGNAISGNTFIISADATVGIGLGPADWANEGNSGDDEDHAYIIYNKDQLNLLAHRVNGTNSETANDYEGKYFKLGNDITYNPDELTIDNDNDGTNDSNYEAIKGFNGHFDGDDKTVSGIRIYKSAYYGDFCQGLFGLTGSSADIHNVTLANADITGGDYTGGIVGENQGTVSNCHVTATVAIHTVQPDVWDHGGIVGENLGTIRECISAATLTNTGNGYCTEYGGIAGYNEGTMSNNLAIGAVVPEAAENNAYGAICGWNYDGTLENNYYAACTVAGVANAVGVGCGGIYDGGDYTVADITDDDGAVPALRDNADNSDALTLVAKIATAGFEDSPLDLGWGEGEYPMQLAGRTLYKDGAWNTLCLPFNVTIEGSVLDGAEVKTLTSSAFAGGTLTLNFSTTSETTLTAGKPYLVRWTKPDDYVAYDGTNAAECSDLVNPAFAGVTVSTATANVETDCVDFIGILSPTVIYESGAEKTNLYMGSANKLYYPTVEGFKLNACRGYFKLKGVVVNGNGNDNGNENAIRSFDINFGDDATGIVEMRDEKGEMRNGHEYEDGGWYTVDGRRLDGKPTRPGVYINSGRQVVIK